MKWQQLITDCYERVLQILEKTLDSLTEDDLNQQPRPDCNSMGWIAWHVSRVLDRWLISDLTGEEQLWLSEGWHARFNRPSDPEDTGWHHSSHDVAAFQSPDVQTLLQYHQAVLERTKRYIASLSAADLDRQFKGSEGSLSTTIGGHLVGIISENLQHAGQMAYLRGLLKGKGWSDW